MGHWKTYEVTFFNLFSVYKDKNNHRYTWVIVGERGRKRERKREREKESERGDRVGKEV